MLQSLSFPSVKAAEEAEKETLFQDLLLLSCQLLNTSAPVISSWIFFFPPCCCLHEEDLCQRR